MRVVCAGTLILTIPLTILCVVGAHESLAALLACAVSRVEIVNRFLGAALFTVLHVALLLIGFLERDIQVIEVVWRRGLLALLRCRLLLALRLLAWRVFLALLALLWALLLALLRRAADQS